MIRRKRKDRNVDVVLHIRAEDPDQLERWKKAAKRDRRSLSAWVATLLERAIEEEGK